MRDQLNGQLYDAWRTDCDVGYDADSDMEYDKWCYVIEMDAYSHSIIPSREDSHYDSYEDRLAD